MDLKAFEKALEQLHNGKHKQARKAFEKLAGKSDDPFFRERCLSYARACEQREAGDPSDAEPMARAVALLNDGAFDDAETILKDLSHKHPKDDVAWFTLACLYARKGDHTQAMDALKRAVQLNPINRVYAANQPDFHGLQEQIQLL